MHQCNSFLNYGSNRMLRFTRSLTICLTLAGTMSLSQSVRAQESDVVAGDPLPGNTADWLLVSTFDCFVDGCQYENAVLRYEPTTGAFLGVHIANISGPSGIAVHPVRGTLLVASRSTNRVKEYNARNGVFLRDFIIAGAEGLNLPQGLLFRANGNLLVTSSQSASNLNGFNGILEFNGTTGAFVSEFVNGGFLGTSCGSTECLFGPNSMVYGPNGNIYVTSGSNDMVIEYNSNGGYVGKFSSSQLDFPVGIAIRPNSVPRAGNILVTSRYKNPANPNDTHKILEFDKNTRLLINPGSIYASGLVNPGPLYWHTSGALLVDDRTLTEAAPTFADRIIRLNRDTGAFLGAYTAANDGRLHQATAMLQITVNLGNASNDFDGDDDVDLKDFGAFQRCFGSGTGSQCLTSFDDDLNAVLDGADLSAFHLSYTGPLP